MGDLEGEPQALLGQFLEIAQRQGALVRLVVEIRQQADLAGNRLRQHARHAVPVPVENNARHDGLQQHQRRHQNDQRALKQPGWKMGFEKAVEAKIKRVTRHASPVSPDVAHIPPRVPFADRAGSRGRPRSSGATG